MPDTLTSDLNRERDIVDRGTDGKTGLVWYLDYTSVHTRRIREVMRRTADRFGPQNVSLAYRFLPNDVQGNGAEIAARAAIAAARQGAFLEMHRALFSRPPQYSEALVLALADTLGLDCARLKADLYSDETTAFLNDHAAAAEVGNVRRTPALFIDGRFYEAAWDETSLIEHIQQPLGVRMRMHGQEFISWAASAGLALVLMTVLALVVVNIGFQGAYEHLRETLIGLSAGDWSLSLTLEVWVNDGLMALFFLLVGIEIKREIVDGELSDMSRAALPIIGAIGGMVVPALIYYGINYGTESAHGWGIPMATDIAFTLGILALLGSRVPTSLKVFVSALAIADDLGAILVIALFYGHGFNLDALLWAVLIFAVMLAMNRGRIYSRIPYMILGVFLWYFVHESGLHATLAGVLTAAAIPSRRSGNVQGVAAQTAAIFEAEMETSEEAVGAGALNRLQSAIDRLREPGFHLQHALESWSNFLILPLFAFFNTGIMIAGSSFSPLAPEALGVIAGLSIGKPLGIFGLVYIAVKLGWAQISPEISWMQLLGAGCLAGVGFTMSIFIGSAAFQGDQLGSVKLAILLASALSAVMGSIILILAARKA